MRDLSNAEVGMNQLNLLKYIYFSNSQNHKSKSQKPYNDNKEFVFLLPYLCMLQK